MWEQPAGGGGEKQESGERQHCLLSGVGLRGLQLPAAPTVTQEEPLGPGLLGVVGSPITTATSGLRSFLGLRCQRGSQNLGLSSLWSEDS